MDVDQLRYFLRVAETMNFTRAADAIGMSQSTLSRSIQKLEDELGQPVFERRPRALALTEAGERLLTRGRQILALIDDTLAEITDDGQSGTIRVGAIPTIAPFFLPDLLQKFSQEFPRATVIVQEATTETLLKRCAQGELDVVILALPITAKYLQVDVLFDEELFLVLPPGHRLVTKRRVVITDLEAYSFVLLDEAHCLADNVLSLCRRGSLEPVVMERTSQLAMVQELVALAHGISMMPAMARALDDSPRRVYRSLSGTRPTRRIAMVTNPYRFTSRLLREFQTRIQQQARNFEASR